MIVKVNNRAGKSHSQPGWFLSFRRHHQSDCGKINTERKGDYFKQIAIVLSF
jgi:hypothetical protein